MRTSRLRSTLLCISLCWLQAAAHAQSTTAVDPLTNLVWSTDAVAPQRFVAVHGRRALVMGYPESGLEIWAYPLQLLSNYQVSFLPQGETQALTGSQLLRRIEYGPEEVIRTYVGPDFIVRETIFVPLAQPGAILSYQVEGTREISISVQFVPVLNLMWPAALGGQSTRWDEALSGYVITEPLHGYTAAFASPQAAGHDLIENRTIQRTKALTLSLKPAPGPNKTETATIFVGYDPPGVQPASGIIKTLESQQAQSRLEARKHYGGLLDGALQIQTPDAEVNRALAWAVLGLDQAWVCNPSLGCGEVAGYGPSRGERRPQYAWYFGGDGLVATEALLAAGEYDRAREELAFITKYQDAKTGMIWHEISQGVPLDEWKQNYGYMYVHVDITFAYLATLAHYMQTTGDDAFIAQHWDGIQAAYRYCESVIDAATGLPQIPPGREGANEQERMRDDVGLSSSWVQAAEAYSQLAERRGAEGEAKRAAQAADRARKAIAALDWDTVHHFWLEGHRVSGEPMYSQRPNPSGLLSQGAFTEEQAGEILDQIASPAFQTDWGVRMMSSSSPEYDPNSYGKGSVSALGSSEVAQAFWRDHRSLVALEIWDALLPWNTLDSQGHIHEVLAGDFYHPEIESVPEQTWSSAGYLSATVRGLLGLRFDALHHRLEFAPHLPAQWGEISVRNVRVADSLTNLHIGRQQGLVTLQVENTGSPVTLNFSPEVPLGVTGARASCVAAQGKRLRLPVKIENHRQDAHATVEITVPPGKSECSIAYSGGVQLAIPAAHPAIGAASKQLKVGGVELRGDALTIHAYILPSGFRTLYVETSRKLLSVQGAHVLSQDANSYAVELDAPPQAQTTSETAFLPVTAVLRFADK